MSLSTRTWRARAYRAARNLYWTMPLGRDAKDRLVVMAYRLGGRAFAGMPHYESWLRGQRPPPPLAQVRGPVPPERFDQALAALRFPQAQAPRASIVIPAYGDLPHVLACLESIAAHPPACDYEVIVADDASGDPHIARLREVPGLRLVEHPRNLGFLRSVNAAVASARGQWLCLLNADTEVTAGALDAMLRLLRDTPQAGIVGAKLVYPDGRLQEAGGILWRDGSAWNYGRFDDPQAAEYGFVRDVDYVSAAALVMPLALFRELDGFDQRYAPAYCEDSDLAMRVRERGLRVLYQPDAVVIHHEGVSHGRDTALGVKAGQVQNQQRLRERWQGVLEAGHFANGSNLARARERGQGPVILVVDNALPEPDRDAGSRTLMDMIDALQALGWRVKFWAQNLAADPVYARPLQQRGIEVIHGNRYRACFGAWLAAHAGVIDAVLLSRPAFAHEAIGPVRRHLPQARVLFYGHDLHHARFALEGEVTGDAAMLADARRLRALEQAVWRQADCVLYPSQAEVDVVRAQLPSVHARAIAPYALDGVPVAPGLPLAQRRGVLFVAGFGHTPNIDAAQWLVREVWPLVRAARPGAVLTLAGSNPTPAVLALAGDDVRVTGSLSEQALAAQYASARVALVPLRIGAGIKRKVVEAMHFGVPVVTTPIGAQGLEDAGDALQVAADAQALAQRTIALLGDDPAWQAQAALARDWVAGRFSAQAIREVLAQELNGARTSGTR